MGFQLGSDKCCLLLLISPALFPSPRTDDVLQGSPFGPSNNPEILARLFRIGHVQARVFDDKGTSYCRTSDSSISMLCRVRVRNIEKVYHLRREIYFYHVVIVIQFIKCSAASHIDICIASGPCVLEGAQLHNMYAGLWLADGSERLDATPLPTPVDRTLTPL